MSRRQTPIDKMRELADDGLEPWQIAAALGVREQTVLVALEAREPAGGAQRAVEDAASLAPTKPDTLAPTRPVRGELTVPATTTDEQLEQIRSLVDDDVAVARALPTGTMRNALVEHVAVTVCGPDDVDDTDGVAGGDAVEASEPEQIHKPAPEPEFDPDDASTYPCATGGDCGCVGTGLSTCPGGDEDRVDEARRARDEAADRILDALAAAAVEHVHDPTDDGLIPSIPHVIAAGQGDEPPARVVYEPHVHDPFPVADEAGVWHAECECGTRWDRASCDICGVPVAALHIARTGLRRHAHHRTA